MLIVIETYNLLRKMGTWKAYSTDEIIKMSQAQRCAVLKKLHRLQDAGYIEGRPGKEQEFYWMVVKMPEKPKPPKQWKESRSLQELAELNE